MHAENQFSYMVLVVQLMSTVMLPIVQTVSGRIGKKNTYYIGISILVCDLIGMFFIGENQIVATYVCAAIAGENALNN